MIYPVLLLLLLVKVANAGIDNLAFLGHNEINPFHLMDVEIVGDRAYVANGLGTGLEVYDISDPTDPQRIYRDGPSAWRCQSYGDTLLFLFCRRDGVKLYDISSVNQPVAQGLYNPSGNQEALEGGAMVGDAIYCAAHQNGIYVIDITNPLSPQKVGEFAMDSSAAWNVEVSDSFLFVANGRFGLTVIGLTNSMHLVSTLSLPGLTNDINLDGNVAAISLGADGFATVDISNPYNPNLLDIIATDGNVWGSGIANHQVISGSWRVMELFDISDPGNIARTGWDNTKTWAMGADIRDDGIVAVADWRGMSCYDIGPDGTSDIDIYPQILDFGSVHNTKDTTVVVRNTGSALLNISSIDTPTEIAVSTNSFSVQPGDSQIVTVTATGSGNVNGHITYYTNDPDEPSRTQEVYKNNTGFPQVGSPAPDFTLLGTDNNYHTLSDYNGKVIFLEFGGAWWPLCGPQAAATDASIFSRYDTSQVVIFEIGSTALELNEFVEVFGQRFTGLIDNQGVYSTYRVPRPEAPYPQDYIIDQHGIIRYWSDEYDPQEIIKVIDHLLDIAVEEQKSRTILRPRLKLSITPNPFKHITDIRYEIPRGVDSSPAQRESSVYSQEQKTAVSIKIFDATGTLVKDLLLPTAYSPDLATRSGVGIVPTSIKWDGTDHLNHKLPAGVYFVYLELNGQTITETVVLTK